MNAIATTGPMLDAREEAELFRRHRDGDARATRRLVEAHMPLIHKVAGRYSHFGANHDDAVQEGVAGFVHGLGRFDPDLGYRINTLCRWWVRATVAEWARGSHSLIKIGTTATQKRLYVSLRDALARRGHWDGDPVPQSTIAQIAAELGATVDEVEEMRVRLAPGAITSLDAPRSDDDAATRVETIADETAGPREIDDAIDEHRRSEALRRAVATLDPRKRDIIERRYLADEAETLEDLSRTHGVTRERIRQLEVQAIEQIGLSIPAALSRSVGDATRRRAA